MKAFGDRPLGSDLCMCGDYRSQHGGRGIGSSACRVCAHSKAPYDGCVQFRFSRYATELEVQHWAKYHRNPNLRGAEAQRRP